MVTPPPPPGPPPLPLPPVFLPRPPPIAFLDRPDVIKVKKKVAAHAAQAAKKAVNLSNWATIALEDEVVDELRSIGSMSHSRLINATSAAVEATKAVAETHFLEASEALKEELEVLWNVAPILLISVGMAIFLCCRCICLKCCGSRHNESDWLVAHTNEDDEAAWEEEEQEEVARAAHHRAKLASKARGSTRSGSRASPLR